VNKMFANKAIWGNKNKNMGGLKRNGLNGIWREGNSKNGNWSACFIDILFLI
jgi:hypothetical protein